VSVSPDSIVCGVDAGPAAGELARVARDVANALDARLNLVHVVGTPSTRPPGARAGNDLDETVTMVDELTVALGDPNVARHIIRVGDPGRRIARFAEDSGAGLIVVGTRGNAPVTGDLGSVSVRVAADAPCPVLVVPAGLERHVKPDAWHGRTLLCGFDGSSPARSAACHTAMLASRLGASLRVVTVGTHVPPETVSDLLNSVQVAARGQAATRGGPVASLDVRHEFRGGDPVDELERVAAAATSPLIAVGSSGLNPRPAALLGAVARRMLRQARRPILVVPATSIAREPWSRPPV
jgi:nucleotide-binding universal stress UspA family protein